MKWTDRTRTRSTRVRLLAVILPLVWLAVAVWLAPRAAHWPLHDPEQRDTHAYHHASERAPQSPMPVPQ